MTRTALFSFTSLCMLTFMPLVATAKPAADTNQDGIITRSEFDAASLNRFEHMDLNNDGYISQDERLTARETRQNKRQEHQFDRLDQNGDGIITREEFSQANQDRKNKYRQKRLAFADQDQDGQISKEERQQAIQKRQSIRAQSQYSDHSSNKLDNHHMKQHTRKSGLHKNRLNKVDINGDGLISYQEYVAGADKMFEHLDANGDGVLSKGEGMRRSKKSRRRFFRRR